MALSAVAQTPATKSTPPKTAPPKPAPKAEPVEHPEPPGLPRAHRGGGEKALAVDPNVNIKLPCISQARVTVNGWQRDEVRVFVRNGSDVSFKVHEKDPKSGKPIWILITQQLPGVRATPMSECLSGDRIDIEVPYGATLSISGRETETRIDSVKKVSIKNLGGNVALRNISGGIVAETYEGDVSVESSAGQISLKTSTGNIIAYGVGPGQVGDVFKAGTSNGSITLQKIEHRQIEATSVSGTLVFNGKFLSGGLYAFKTSNGTVRLAIPEKSSCRVVASYGFGSFNSEIPMEILTENVSAGGKSLNARIGSGDAVVNLTTTNGRLLITRQEP
jgi:hypothetical protein